MDAPVRKPRAHFDVVADPSHVTFDDGRVERRNLPWMAYVGSRWDYADPNLVRLEMGGWAILIEGRNLAPIFAAIEERTLLRIRARPEWEADPEHGSDSFATSIRWQKVPNLQVVARLPGQGELPLGQ